MSAEKRSASPLDARSSDASCATLAPGTGPHPVGFKSCPKCRVEKQAAEFSKCRSRSDGLQGWCKACRAALKVVYRATFTGAQAPC